MSSDSQVIDADTHVIESERTWEGFGDAVAGAGEPPQLVETVDGHTGRVVRRWLIGGRLVPKPDGLGGAHLGTPPLDLAASARHYGVPWSFRSFEDPVGRAEHAATKGVGRQVVYPTLFLAHLTDEVALDVALCRSYNRFMAKTWAESDDRFSWVVIPPTTSVDASIEEISGARAHGAAGVFFHGLEGSRSLADPYFYPIYEAAQAEDLAICVHTGPGCGPLLEMADNRYMGGFGQNRVLPLVAFHDLISRHIPERFPSLRFSFLEATASWVPFMLHFLQRVTKGAVTVSKGPQLFAENRMYVAFEMDEDLPYLVDHIGPDNLILGSDYGHADQSAELDALASLPGHEGVDDSLAQRIGVDNPQRLYGFAAAS